MTVARSLATLVVLAGLVQATIIFYGAFTQLIVARDMAGGMNGTADALLERALALEPDSPALLRLAARAETSSEARLPLLQRRVEAAPNNGAAWAELFAARAASGRFDTLTDKALRRAAALAPYEPEVQYVLIRSGMLHWHRLDPGQRPLIVAAGARALENQTDYLKEELDTLLRATGLRRLVCANRPDLRTCGSTAE